MSEYQLHRGDCREIAKQLPQESFHALLCDPPYELGFMGKAWDRSGVAFDPETWKTLAGCLIPGAFGLAFASSRGWHRLACAIEDAGLDIHPTIFNYTTGEEIELNSMLGWSFGSGFPKATRVDAPGFEGHRYGRQAMKPALEPIILFQKPYQGKAMDCITSTGAGALNIEGSRIATDEELREGAGGLLSHVRTGKPYPRGREQQESTDRRYPATGGTSFSMLPGERSNPAGRWPANLVIGSPKIAQKLDAQSGMTGAQAPVTGNEPTANGFSGAVKFSGMIGRVNPEHSFRDDQGGASRFFFNVARQLDEADPVFYCGKVSRSERDAGVYEDKRPMLWSKGTQNPGSFQAEGTDRSARNPHPTLKPIDLCRWLATLLLPPSHVSPRRILVPFCGTGSEMIGAVSAGWEEIVGVDLDEPGIYLTIAEARLKHWRKIFARERHQLEQETAQGDLFAAVGA